MSYAIIETGGKQLRVEPGRFYDIDLLPAAEGDQVSLENVLLVQDNGDVHIGQPLVEGALVEGTVMRHLRGKKIIVYKMRPKKKTRKKRGHRQELTRLMIDSISINGKVLVAEEKSLAAEPQTSTTEVTSVSTETVTETTTESTEVSSAVETISAQIPETTTEVETASEEPQTSATEVTPVSTETVTETTTEPTEVSSPVETDAEIPETTAEVETSSEEKPENQAE